MAESLISSSRRWWETNTIGSKSNDLYINERVIGIKVEIEKMREQVQNVE
jgi:uncharacterized protein YicC (UPF0701 family)